MRLQQIICLSTVELTMHACVPSQWRWEPTENLNRQLVDLKASPKAGESAMHQQHLF